MIEVDAMNDSKNNTHGGNMFDQTKPTTPNDKHALDALASSLLGFVPMKRNHAGNIEIELDGGEHIEISPTANAGGWTIETHIPMQSGASNEDVRALIVACKEISSGARAIIESMEKRNNG